MPPHIYREFYGIQLLDDLHNYFPALLYAPENFVSVRDVLLYLRTRANEEMNLFSMGQRDYNNTRVRQTNRVQNLRPSQTTYRYSTRQPSPRVQVPIPDDQPNVRIRQTTIPIDGTDQSINMLASLFTLFAADNVYDNLDPVIVRPSAEHLEHNTTIYIAGEQRQNCSVCLEMPAIGAEMRRINGCGHAFHRRCIDIWFQRNVHCPVCRHDVREAENHS